MPDTIPECIAELEKELGLPDGFYQSLRSESDWALIIKCHAIVESALTYLLTTVTAIPALEGFFARLETSDKYTGKVAFARALGKIKDDDVRFISKLSEIRNRLVHNVRNVQFSLAAFVSTLDRNQYDALEATLGTYTAKGMLRSDPRQVVWLGTMICIALIYLDADTHRMKSDLERKKLEHFRSVYDAFSRIIHGRSTGDG